MVRSKNEYKIEYFVAGLEKEGDMKASAVITQLIHNKFKDVFTGHWLF